LKNGWGVDIRDPAAAANQENAQKTRFKAEFSILSG
jgi:hypothetical protein